MKRHFALAVILMSASVATAQSSGTFSDLGVQITSSLIQGATFSRDAAGRDLVFTVMRGEPAKLMMLDARTGAFIGAMPLDGAHGAWNACTATDGSVYLGADDNGHLYRYVPGEQSARDLGLVLPDQTFVWDVAPGADGEVFAGTYPGCNVVRYHPDDGFTDVGRGPVAPGENYVRALAWDSTTRKVYAGVGAHAKLIALNPVTGEKTNILPERFATEAFVYGVDAIEGQVFASIMNVGETAVIDASSHALRTTIGKTSAQLPVSPREPGTSNVYLQADGNLVRYDLKTTKIEIAIESLGASISAFTWMDNVEGFDGPVLVAMTRQKRLLRFSPQGKKHDSVALGEMPSEPVPIQSIALGPDGKIYSSGYLVGGVSSYDPQSGKTTQLGALSQAEDIAVLGDTVYFGLYPHARLVVLDTTRPWSTNNPKQFGTLYPDKQDRPMAMLGVPSLGERGKLFIGTIPGYGLLGGVLARYDPQRDKLSVHRDIVPAQSIVDLVYHPGTKLLFASTSIFGGLGIEPSASEAVVFAWDESAGRKVFEIAPVEGAQIITGLMVGPDDNIWGIADGTLFVLDPRSREVLSRTLLKKIHREPGQHAWRHAWLATAPDGTIFGVMSGILFRLDAASKQITVLRDKDCDLLTLDRAGWVYFKDRTHLIQFTP